jgi:hypothetical protein
VYVRVDKVLLLVRVDGHQGALILRAACRLCPFVILQLIHVLETLFGAKSGPAVWTRVFVLDFVRSLVGPVVI